MRITPGHLIADYVILPRQKRALASAIQELETEIPRLIDRYFPLIHILAHTEAKQLRKLTRLLAPTEALNSLIHAYSVDEGISRYATEPTKAFATSFFRSYLDYAKEILDLNRPDLDIRPFIVKTVNKSLLCALAIITVICATILAIDHVPLHLIFLDCITLTIVSSIALTILIAIGAIFISRSLAPSGAEAMLTTTLYFRATNWAREPLVDQNTAIQIGYILRYNRPPADNLPPHPSQKSLRKLITELIAPAIKIGLRSHAQTNLGITIYRKKKALTPCPLAPPTR